ncbi:ESX secretion-associated protein EspG [Nocardia sp. CNY236]|uniref:ESX secretion-associated protein EspG n=1 Tax=Nocardia sp. CNY236 TaxID=1169152 RepID=UPI0003FB294B|nr:ESX secretion-associated protein EspG [Nocardia sp. CNY236]
MTRLPIGKRYRFGVTAFQIALEANGRDRAPFPLSYRRERVDHLDDDLHSRKQAAERLQAGYDETLHDVFGVLLEPQTRVEITGTHGQQRQDLRIFAGISGPSAVLAVQEPGRTPAHGGDIVLTTHAATTIAADIVARLPQSAPGRAPHFEGRRSDLTTPVYAQHPTRLSPVEQVRQFFRRRRVGSGEITTYPGYQLDWRPTDDGRGFFWLDYPDGRYLLTNHDAENFTVLPADPETLMRQLSHNITACTQPRAFS